MTELEVEAQVGRIGAEVLSADGLVMLPGLVDLHTHLREPGREDAETIATGSMAAAKGGYTAVHAMANTEPVADTAGVVEQVWRAGREVGLVDVRPVGAVTVGLAGERLAELGAMANSPAQVRVFSDDGKCVADSRLMRRALEYVRAFDGVIAQHAEDSRLTQDAQMDESALSGQLGLVGWPAVAEEAIIARDCLLASHVGSRLHVCHVTTAGGVELIRWAKSRGTQVSGEACPHHLFFDNGRVSGYNPVFKVNPPLRSPEDVLALRAGVVEGDIEVVATDHAPHPREAKDCEWPAAAFGMLGLETALSVTYKALGQNASWELLANRMSIAPARIARLFDQGRPIAEGEPANFALVDAAATWVVEPEKMSSLSKNTPFAGEELPLRVVGTIFKGRITNWLGQLVG
jgi:dihydroorotase